MLRKLIPAAISLVSVLVLLTSPAEAQISRVFVSVTGNDANVCSNLATPCRTLAGGISQVDPDGEVIVTESGSYAGGTIAKPVKVNVASGVVAFSGLPFVVNPGAGNRVVLRGLTIKAVTVGSGVGITHQTGILYVENSVVDGWGEGLRSQAGGESLLVKGSVFRNNNQSGLFVVDGSTASVAIDGSFFENNGFVSNYPGIYLRGGIGRVSNTVMSRNAFGALAENGGVLTVQRCEVSGNYFGIAASGLGAIIRVSESTLTRNLIAGLQNFDAFAIVESFGNNVIRGNTLNTDGAITMVTLQ